jgi:hypothetical protein
MARMLVESLKRLYDNLKVTKEQLLDRVNKGVLTIQEYYYIIGEDEKDD